MSKLPVLRFPDPRLRTVAKPVETVNQSIKKLVTDMYETMYDKAGVGLAATQVDVHLRVVVTDCPIDSESEAPNPVTFINPEIIERSEEFEISQEGCLSVPEIYADVERSKVVTVRALNEKGELFERQCEGLLAVCIQHEIDHLNGKLFVDYLSAAKRNLIRDKMKKYEKKLAKATQEASQPA